VSQPPLAVQAAIATAFVQPASASGTKISTSSVVAPDSTSISTY